MQGQSRQLLSEGVQAARGRLQSNLQKSFHNKNSLFSHFQTKTSIKWGSQSLGFHIKWLQKVIWSLIFHHNFY